MFSPKTQTSLLHFICLLTFTGITRGQSHGSVVKVVDGRQAILPCSLGPEQNIQQMVFDWKKDGGKEVFFYDAGIHYNNGRSGQDEQFKGRVSHFEEQLRHGNASIMIRNTKVADSGNYTCVFPLLKPERKTFNIELIVDFEVRDRSAEITGAAPAPYIRILNATDAGVLLQCEVRGASPKPKVEWQDSDGNVLPAEEPQVSESGGRYNVTLRTTVTKTTSNHFHCVAKQEDFGHRIEGDIYLPEKLFEDRSKKKLLEDRSHHVATGFISGWFSGILTLAAALALCVYTYDSKLNCVASKYHKNGHSIVRLQNRTKNVILYYDLKMS
ncbi:V-set domain containing T-cell activation inhibitor 1-like isoform X5 [Toxotes jaculatrix]|uniref:V-set domain containing T-cell activation inhibitor 1-like isoform X5 n=1 Tax=Toxotes jaculatrix TaxID=941984 RepID=UPI001B3B17A9|nr:V-set domain containing T-cell activation inhibitor 1-like isoform X5 [Toxotes jaculatrix]